MARLAVLARCATVVMPSEPCEGSVVSKLLRQTCDESKHYQTMIDQSESMDEYDSPVALPDGPEISCLEERRSWGSGTLTFATNARYMPICLGHDPITGAETCVGLGTERLEPVPSGKIVGRWWVETTPAGRHHLCYQVRFDHETGTFGWGEIHRSIIRLQDLKDRYDLPCIPDRT